MLKKIYQKFRTARKELQTVKVKPSPVNIDIRMGGETIDTFKVFPRLCTGEKKQECARFGTENSLTIGKNETLSIDGIVLKKVSAYELKHSDGKTAELTVTLVVNVNQS